MNATKLRVTKIENTKKHNLILKETRTLNLKIALSEKLSKHEGEWNMQNHHKWGNPVFVPKNQCGSKLATPQQLKDDEISLSKIHIFQN